MFALVALLVCSVGARATDTYNGVNLTIPTLYVGNATYSNVVVQVGNVLSGPTAGGFGASGDTYSPAAGALTVAAVMVGDSTYFNVVITVKAIISIGSVSGADTYASSQLTISQVQVGSAVYNNVVLAVAPANIVKIVGGMPLALMDQYTPSAGELLIPAVQVGSKVFTNVTIRAPPRDIVSIGGGTAPQLTALGPNIVNAGGGAFQLIVSGTNFDANSFVEWNGTVLSTQLISPTELNASVESTDIASPGANAVMVANFESAGTLVSDILTFTVATSSTPTVLQPYPRSISLSTDTSLGGGPYLNEPFSIVVNGGAVGATYYYSVSYVGSALSQLGISGSSTSVTGTTTPSGPTAGRITGEPDGGEGGIVTGSFIGPTLYATSVAALYGASMGAGTYGDVITASLCADPQCTEPLVGSPVTIPVTYTVTGNPISDAEFTLYAGAFILEEPTSANSGATASRVIMSNGLPPYGAYVLASAGTGAAVASTSAQSNLNGSATLAVTSKPPAPLGSGIYTDSVQVNICFDVACTKPAGGFPVTIPVTYIVDASPGIDFTAKSIPGQIAGMAWSAPNQRIYAVTPSYAASNPNSLLVINPLTASIETMLTFQSEADPNALSLSDDGQYAYVLLEVPNEVVRVLLSTLTIDQTIPVSSVAVGSIVGLAVAPGAPHTVAMTTYNNYTTLSVYDDTVQRPQTFSTGSLEIQLFYTWGANASTIYAYDDLVTNPTMYQLAASSNGLAVAQTVPGVALQQGNLESLQYNNGLVYSNTASTYNPLTNAVQAPFALLSSNPDGISHAGSVTIDDTLNRAFIVTDDTPNQTPGEATIEGFSLSTLQPTWVTRSPTGMGNLLRWGTNGLAFTSGSVVAPNITLISGSIVSR
jgi:hypothetical protein